MASKATRNTTIGGGIATGVLAVVAGVIAVEGWFSDDKADPGGATKYGITERVARAHGYAGAMKDLPEGLAEQIYLQDYVVKPSYDKLFNIAPVVAHKVIDGGVNVGPVRETTWFQISVNALSRGCQDYDCVHVDGVLGPLTFAAYKALSKKRGAVQSCEMTLKLLDAQQAVYYMSLNMPKFTVGWIAQRVGNIPLPDCHNQKEGAA